MSITREEFNLLREYIKEQSGIALDYGKEYLIESRLTFLMVQCGCLNFGELYRKLVKDNGNLRNKVIDAITTNETLWFRDDTFFNALADNVVPWLIERARSREVRIWSAACSTGQEPYSIAMLIENAVSKGGSGSPPFERFEILATDISPSAIFMAVSARYSHLAISRGMREDFLSRYFNKDGAVYELDKKIRSIVKFKQMNLKDSFMHLGKFDFILCRNVLIYFSDDFKRDIYSKVCMVLQPDGLLAIGASESLSHLTSHFEQSLAGESVLYGLQGAGAAAI